MKFIFLLAVSAAIASPAPSLHIAPSTAPILKDEASFPQTPFSRPEFHKPYLLRATVRDLQAYLKNGSLTSEELVRAYLCNIAQDNHQGLNLRAVLETAPYDSVIAVAKDLDAERARGTIRSELHGIPMLFKDNIATNISLGMNTTAGSRSLLGMSVSRDSAVSAQLRAAGVIVLGKANLNAFSGWYSDTTPDGWSPRGGKTTSAYVAGGSPAASSGGSAVGVSAGFGAAALGTETTASIVKPCSYAALYGIKPTNGIKPVSLTMDSVGPMAKSTYDCALILENMVGGYDEGDPTTLEGSKHAETNYTQFTDPSLATFKGKRIGVPMNLIGFDHGIPRDVRDAFHHLLSNLTALGAHIEPVFLAPPPMTSPALDRWDNVTLVLNTEMKEDLEGYLGELEGTGPRTLEDVINFNDAHTATEFLPPGQGCCQHRLIRSVQTHGRSDPAYLAALESNLRTCGPEGIDAVMMTHNLSALLLPAPEHSTTPAAACGYPVGVVPAGRRRKDGRPWGAVFVGGKWSEPTLISLMAAFEASFPGRAIPERMGRHE